MLINIGPQHPPPTACSGWWSSSTARPSCAVSAPRVSAFGLRKLGEYRHYNQIIPLTDRTDYLSPMSNNVGFALAAEKLMGSKSPRAAPCCA